MNHVFNSTGHELKIPDIIKCRGTKITDSRGREYTDMEAGVWCLSLGHNHPGLNRVISRQMEVLMQSGFCYSTEVVEDAAETLLKVAGMENGKTVFLSSGSEAIEISRQIARYITGFQTSMTLSDSYLGAYSSVSRRDRDWFCFNWKECKSCKKADSCDSDCSLLKEIPRDISDFVFEPGSSSGFVRFPPIGLIEKITGRVRENGGKIIVNEVTTGTGRTGRWWGFQHYGIKPDMLAAGKGIGGGYPVSAACLSRETVSALEGSGFKYSQSHQNDALGAAVVKEIISVIETEGLIERSRKLGETFLSELKTLADGNTITAVRGRGLMFALDFRDSLTAGTVYNRLLDKGFITGNRGTALRIDPPLIITGDEFSHFTQTLKKVSAGI